jgi:group I intron endonuclease
MRIIHHAKRIYFFPLSEKARISIENRNQAGVYALICRVTNKNYVGGSVNLAHRLLDYMQPAYLAKQANRPIVRAIVKYGVVNFAFIVLETCNPSETLTREQYWLDLLNPDYNLCRKAGSTLGVPLSVEAKAKLSTAHLGKTHTLETRRLMSETRKGSNAYWYGKMHSEETKAKIAASLKGPLSPCFGVPRSSETVALMRANHPHTKRVYQFASDQISLVAKFDSIRQAAELTGISRNYIYLCIKQEKLAHGKWFFSLTPPV